MKRLKIVGGGMTGILAAMHAHRLGARDIELHERLDRLGGVALPELRDGMEMREGCIYFGPQGNAMRALLEEHGATFTDFENRFGSVSPGEGELVYVEDFGGPAFASSQTSVTAPQGPTLLDRLSCYDSTIAGPALAYARWHLGCDPSQLHESAATPLAINRIYPSGADADELTAAKQSDPQADELLAIPRSLWGRTANVTASLPLAPAPRSAASRAFPWPG